MGGEAPTPVFLPPAMRDGKKTLITKHHSPAPSFEENINRIYFETDPIGLLIAIANGTPVATYHYNEATGEIETIYESLPVHSPQRQAAIKALANFVQPRVSVSMSKKKDNVIDAEWEATIANRAESNE